MEQLIVIPSVSTIMIVSVFMTILMIMTIFTIMMMFPITRYVHLVVPAILNEIDRPATSAIFITVSVPVSNLTGRNAEIDRWSYYSPHNYRFWVD